ncbi:LysR substrate binding domain protein [Roseovarius litorisediminis]|uniref:LysR substrate binding domain protein n=1 Tax=Roseovarius litorisediminis TaxID=1312363 RepID=A0A1Y5TGR1_9RHOB|nr:LysR substrate-binding domain-containing protein [Roseovarius litorisediminis]SLN63514.1 LysR substrate binding domain protein [Roseovarius litorisediminis]
MNGVKYKVNASGNFVGNTADADYRGTFAGLGIARLPTYLVAAKIASGELIRVLSGYTQDHAAVALTFADNRNLAPRTRAFVDFLVVHFNKMRAGVEDGCRFPQALHRNARQQL